MDFTLYYTTAPTTSEAFLRRALEDSTGRAADRVKLLRQPLGKPYFADPALPCFSLSHSGIHTVCTMGPTPCGVDIQVHQLRNRSGDPKHLLRLAERYFHREEADYLSALPTEKLTSAFFDLWSAKESYVKFTGVGIRQFPSFNVLAPLTPVTVQAIPVETEGVSLCFAAEGDVRCIIKRI